MEEVHHRNLGRKWRRQTKMRRTDIQVCFPSGLTLIDMFRQLKLTERYKKISRALSYNWHGRFSADSANNTSRCLPNYKNCRKVKSAYDVINFYWQSTLREVAEMAGISKYTAQHTLTSNLSMSHMNDSWI